MTPSKEELPTNIKTLSNYINQQDNPREFMDLLFLICKPSADRLPDSCQEAQIGVS